MRKNDQPGDLIEDFGDKLDELAPMEVNLPAEQNAANVVPVSFETVVTETEMVQLVVRGTRRTALEAGVQRPRARRGVKTTPIFRHTARRSGVY